MKVSQELEEKINIIFMDDENMRNRLINGDLDAIRGLQSISGGISPEEVIESYENKTLDSLYSKALRLIQIRELYVMLCNWYAEERMAMNRGK